MKQGTRQALTIGLLVLGVWFFETMRPVGQPPGILAPDPPRITPAAEKPRIFERDGHVLTALAGFEAKARVLSVERYGRDRLARIAPLDLALGWGQLSDTDRLLIAFFAQETGRGESIPEEALLQAAIRDDASIRPYQFRASLEKLVTVGLLRAGSAEDAEGRPVRTVALTAEVYRQWLETAHPYKRLREEGLEWEVSK